MAEMRTILAKIVWSFDVRLCAESADWADQRLYVNWDKPPLMVKLSVAAGAGTA